MSSAFWSGDQSRKILKRIIVEGNLVLQTPAHFGNGDGDDLTDMPLLLDPFDEVDGKETPLLTGASIAGALRSHLRTRQKGYNRTLPEPDDKTAVEQERETYSTKLFGGFKGDDDGEQSPLIVEDVRGYDSGIEFRDGVQLDPCSRTAADKKKFDLQLWHAGTCFPLRFELLVREQEDEAKTNESSQQLKRALAVALHGLTNGEITLGARKRRGYGRVAVRQWRVKEYDLTNVDDLCEWIEHGSKELSDQYAVSDLQTKFGADTFEDARKSFTISATFSLDGSLLIRSGSGSHGPDAVHLHARQPDGSNKAVLSGTSLSGALRARALKIANTIGRVKAPGLIDQMFGKTDQASKLRVSEQVVETAVTNLVQNRVSIDRFTGGAKESALFNEQPVFGNDETLVTIELQLTNPEDYEIGLMLLLLKDLWTSDLPLGGESSVGRGRLKGKSATLTYRNGSVPRNWSITQGTESLDVSGNREELNKYVTIHLHNYFNEPQEVRR